MTPDQSLTSAPSNQTEGRGHHAAPDLDSFEPNVSWLSAIFEIDADDPERADRAAKRVGGQVSSLALNGWPVINVKSEPENGTPVPHFGHSVGCYSDHEESNSRGPTNVSSIPVEEQCGGRAFHLHGDLEDAVFRYFDCSLVIGGSPTLQQVGGTYEFSVGVKHPDGISREHDVHLTISASASTPSFGTDVIEPTSE